MLYRLLFIACLGTFMSCSPNLTYFTSDLPDRYNWNESDLQRIQFYLSDDIVLQRTLEKGESVIAEGKVVLEEGRRIEQIIFSEGTPGVLLFIPKKERMAVSFDEDGGEFLVFGAAKRYNGRYVLMASDWNRREGVVTYNGKKYRTDNQSAFAALLFDISKVKTTDLNQRRVPGRTI